MKFLTVLLCVLYAGALGAQTPDVQKPGAAEAHIEAPSGSSDSPAQAAASADDARARETAARFAAVDTIHSRFVQEKRMALLTEPVVGEGVFSFQKNPARIRWEYTKPFQNGFVIDGEYTFRLEKGVKKAVKGVMARNIAAQMLVWLAFDLPTLSKTYSVTFFDGGAVLKPLSDKNRMLEQITVWFAPDNPQALSKIEMAEPGGDSTMLLFLDTETNRPLPQDAFK